MTQAASTSGLRFRPATRADLAEIARIEARCFPSPWPAQMYEPELERDFGIFFVATEAERVKGYLCGWSLFEDGHLLKLAVAETDRGRGIGRALVDKFMAKALERGAELVWLEVRETNLAALRFYAALDFVESGRRRRYYTDTGEDAIILTRRLGTDDER